MLLIQRHASREEVRKGLMERGMMMMMMMMTTTVTVHGSSDQRQGFLQSRRSLSLIARI